MEISFEALYDEGSDEQCQVPIGDVILFEQLSSSSTKCRPLRWLYTNKRGAISKKKKDLLTWTKIRDRFLKDCKEGDSSNVCVVHMQNGQSHALDRISFLTLVEGAKRDNGLNSVRALQLYIKPKGGKDIIFRNRYQGLDSTAGIKKPTYNTFRGAVKSDAKDLVPSNSKRINEELNSFTSNIVKFIENTKRLRIKSIDIDYTISERDNILLSNISNLTATSKSASSIPMTPTIKTSGSRPSSSNSTSDLPQQSNVYQSSHSNSLPSLHASKSSLQLPLHCDSVGKCNGDFCHLNINKSLDNLRILDYSDKDFSLTPGNSSFNWKKELSKLRNRSTGNGKKLSRSLAESVELYSVPSKSVILARLQMQFITGLALKQMHHDAAKVSAAWAALDTKLQREVSQKQPSKYYSQTAVCGDCYQCYSKISHLRSRQFQVDGTQTQIDYEAQPQDTSSPAETETETETESKREENPFRTRPAKVKVKHKLQKVPTAKLEPSSAESDFLQRHSDETDTGSESGSWPQRLAEVRRELAARHEAELRRVQASLEQAQSQNQQYQSTVGQLDALLGEERATVERLHGELGALVAKYTATSKEYERVIREKEKQQLQFAQQHHKQLALSNSDGSSGVDGAASLRMLEESNAALAGQIAHLNSKIAQLNTQYMREQELVQGERQQEMDHALEQHRQEVSKAKQARMELQEQFDQLKTDMNTKVKQLSIVKNQEIELARQIQVLTSEKTGLEEELHLAHQSLQSLSNSGANDNSDVVMATLKSNYESRLRQVGNEVEFLKSELSNEVRCKDELNQTIVSLNQQFAKSKREFKDLLLDAEDSKRNELSDLETRFKRELDIPRNEVKHLESKVTALQNNLTGLLQDMELCKRREENAVAETTRLAAQLKAVGAEKSSLSANLEELRDTLASATKEQSLDSALKSQQESAIRRLTNEVEFLKSQVQLADSGKLELTNALSQSKVNLSNALAEAGRQQDLKEQGYKADIKALSNQVLKLRELNIQYEAEIANLQSSFDDLHTSHQRLKDELHLAQESNGSNDSVISRLNQEVKSQRNTIDKERALLEELKQANQVALSAMQKTLEDNKAKNANEIFTLKAELAKTHAQLSDYNGTILDLKDEMNSSTREQIRVHALQRMRDIFSGQLRLKQQRSFAKWSAHVRMGEVVRSLTAEHDAAVSQSVAEVTKNAYDKHVEIVKELTAKNEVAVEESKRAALSTAEKEKQQCLAALQEQMDATLASQKQQHVEDIKRLLEEKEGLHKMHTNKLTDDLTHQIQQLNAKLKTQRQSALETSNADKLTALTQLTQEMTQRFGDEKAQLQAQFAAAQEQLRQQHATALEQLTAQMKDDKDVELAAVMEEAEQSTRSAIQQVESEFEAKLLELRQQHEQNLDQQRREHETVLEQQRREHETVLEQLKASSADAQHSALLTQREELGKQSISEKELLVKEHKHEMAKLHKEMAGVKKTYDEKVVLECEAAVQACREEMNKSKANAMKHSTEKWQRLLQECTEEALKDKQELIEKMNASKQAEVSELLSKFEAEQKQKDIGAVNAMRQKLEEASKAHVLELNQLKQQLEVEFHQRLKEREVELERLKQLDIGTIEDKLKKQMNAQNEENVKTMREALERSVKERQLALQNLARESAQQTSQAIHELKLHHQEEIRQHQRKSREQRDQLAKQLGEEARKLIENDAAQHREQLQQHLAKQKQEGEAAAAQELARLRLESETLLSDAEAAISAERKEKEDMQRRVQQSKQQLEESEDVAYDLSNTVTTLKKAGAIRLLQQYTWQLRTVSIYNERIDHLKAQYSRRMSQLQQQTKAELHEMEKQLEVVDDLVEFHEGTHSKMKDTLINYKRDLLLEHKVKSAALQKELLKLSDQKAACESLYNDMLAEVSKIQAQVKDVERQMRELSNISAIDEDGKVNISHAKKKRRLDTEFELMLEKASEKKDKLNNLEKQLAIIEDKRADKEGELKQLEKQLVELLVEQQKKLLHVLNESSQKAKESQKLREKF